ncbi:MAG: PSD1 domain-containing protein [Verrucomicrobiales bacterium]|jgi:mono/diheme cytochrome c family protein|nr:PSD1 domain-containing protein [Verrucomicrobiales bacterium]MBP9224394.1 PSD1 domain-containing protein [Verrucomicrobiales bacterium]HQZ26807.1 PSD1 and planctomycete cytochrome C domain-containing protein [Verrucomicrobiales bacterium]
MKTRTRRTKNLCFKLTLAAAFVIGMASAEGAPNYLREIAPLLERHCLECHGPEKQSGGIRLDQNASALAGGDSGSPSLVPGKPDESELFYRIHSTDKDEQMPPKGDRLSPGEIAILREWIAEGATWPESSASPTVPALRSDHWSFQPVRNPALPEVKDKVWSHHPIDRFLQADREAAGRVPVPLAGPATLLRRVSYDLTGLPPAPEEVAKFLQASSTPESFDKAYQEVVKRLLVSTSHGERWARHWLDWARYADTAGDNSDFPIPQAYLYRNYVIDALNADLPYDRFLTEQLAGDLLPAKNQEEKNRQTIATGYLAIARRFGSLVETYPQHLTIEDTIDNLGRTVFGLTISCARCHDHKFDPISTRDYYGLYGFFASTRYPFPGIELFQTQRDLVPLVPEKEVKAKWGPSQKETDRLTSELEKLLAECQAESITNAEKESSLSLDEQRKLKGNFDKKLGRARKAGETLAKHLKTLPPLATAYAVADSRPINARVQIKGDPEHPGTEVPRRFPDILGGATLPENIAKSGSGRLELAGWIVAPDNPLTARVIVNRIWQRHFGIGLVPGDGDFGVRGEAPTHPELLDWLAQDFMSHGWSLRHLHRLIVTSRTYRLSSQDTEINLAQDPTNQSYWKFSRQRLDAESIRDTLLLLGGTLDRSPQNEPYPIPPAKDWKYTQHHPFKEDYPTTKRSLYQMTKRLTARTYEQTFDGPDPNACTATRDSSVTSLQALFFVNDPFVHEQAASFAKHLLTEKGEETTRLNRAFLATLGRHPSEEESTLFLSHLERVRSESQGEESAWSSVTRSLFRLNEFLYLD